MTSIILAIFLAAGPCHANTATKSNIRIVVTTADTGGEEEHAPNHPIPPIPPSPIPIP